MNRRAGTVNAECEGRTASRKQLETGGGGSKTAAEPEAIPPSRETTAQRKMGVRGQGGRDWRGDRSRAGSNLPWEPYTLAATYIKPSRSMQDSRGGKETGKRGAEHCPRLAPDPVAYSTLFDANADPPPATHETEWPCRNDARHGHSVVLYFSRSYGSYLQYFLKRSLTRPQCNPARKLSMYLARAGPSL